MRAPDIVAARLFFVILLSAMPSVAQQKHPIPAAPTNSSGQGSIAVTCTVVASVGLVEGSDGKLHIIVANGVDPADGVSSFQHVQMKQPETSDQAKSNSRKERDTQRPASTSPR